MKEGWTYKKLGDVALSMADGPFGSNLKKEHYTDRREVRIIQLSNIGEEGWRDDNKKYTTFHHLQTIERSEVFSGDIVIAKMMPAGRAIICPDMDAKYVLSSDAVRVTLKDGIYNRFIYYEINSPAFRKQVYENVTGSGRVRTSLTKLRDCLIGIPTFESQRSIVARLDAAFSGIDSLKANSEKQLSEARQLFQAELTECMRPKEGWEEKTLGDIVVFSQGIQVDVKLQTEICSPGKVRFLRIIDVTQGNVPPRYIDDPGERYFLKADEIAMVRYGTVGFVCYGLEGVIANNLFKISIKDKSKLQSNYLQYFLKSDLFQSHIQKGVGGTALPAIKFGDIKNVLLGFPPLAEQISIVSRLDSLSAKVKQLEDVYRKTLAECDALKQAMLREVFE